MHPYPTAARTPLPLTPTQHARLMGAAKLEAHRLREAALDAAAAALVQRVRRAWSALRGRPARLIEA